MAEVNLQCINEMAEIIQKLKAENERLKRQLEKAIEALVHADDVCPAIVGLSEDECHKGNKHSDCWHKALEGVK